MTYYYNNESECIETIEAVKQGFLFNLNEYDSFSDFLSACMYWNNGALYPIKEGYTKCRFAIGHCTESEQRLVFTIQNVNPITQRVIISCINSPLPIQPCETVSIHQIDLI